MYLNFIKRTKVLVILNKFILTLKLIRIKKVKQSPVIQHTELEREILIGVMVFTYLSVKIFKIQMYLGNMDKIST